jgi:hypothetical protein
MGDRSSTALVGVMCMRRLFQAAIVVAAVMLSLVVVGAQDQPASATKVYDIPAQPLAAALTQYILVSGAQVLYETSISAGRRSTQVKGHFTLEVALATLLGGTGLVAVRTDVDAFIIAPSPASGEASAARPDIGFLSALQNGVLDALCRDPRTRPGGYKVAIELWIASTGVIQHSALIGSTGDPARDDLLTATLRGAHISVSPPPNVAQPYVLAIARRPPRQTGDCSG